MLPTMRVHFIRPDGTTADVIDIQPYQLDGGWFLTWLPLYEDCVMHVRIHPCQMENP